MANKWYPASAFIGGTTGCLDAISGTNLYDGDMAIVIFSSYVCFYLLDADSAETESFPNIIAPDTDAGDKRWVLIRSVGRELEGSIYSALTSNATTTALTLVSGDVLLIPENTSCKFIIDLTARQTAGSSGTVGNSAFWSIVGGVKRDDADNTVLFGTPSGTGTPLSANCDGGVAFSWDVIVEANNTTESLKISVIGEVDKTIKWDAKIVFIEVS